MDLTQHIVVEASAGTGKTHTLVQLTVKLLLAGHSISEILLVTYTEKAAGEIKDRLREELTQQSSRYPALQDGLDDFDQSTICTIHGFCQRVLQEHAFEARQDFRPELVHDRDLVELCLREVQRRSWPTQYQDQLASVLQLADYNQGADGGQKWEEKVLEVAGLLRPSCGNRLLPEYNPTLLADLEKIAPRLCSLRNSVKSAHGPFASPQGHPWFAGYFKLPFRADWREKWAGEVLVPLLRWLADAEAEQSPLLAFHRLLDSCSPSKMFKTNGFPMLLDKVNPPEAAEDCCPGLRGLVDEVEDIRQSVRWGDMGPQLAAWTIHELGRRLAEHKRERGLQSFEDMLSRVDEALDPDRNPRADSLLANVRKQFRVAIVDEFQDTDPVQWRIFKRIFVEDAPLPPTPLPQMERGEKHRLFVVGDPKQAIFGFRGADLKTYQTAVRELQECHGARPECLEENWRSCPEMLTALNHLFDKGNWFADTDIVYQPVRAPEGERSCTIAAGGDRTDRAPVTLLDLRAAETLTRARRVNARFVAGEIGRLLSRETGLDIQDRGQRRPLDARDIGILVFKRKEADPIIEALQAAEIPYTFYKQTGLWQSEEAVHLDYLLRAIARSEDGQSLPKALLTRFFGFRPEELAACEGLPASHPIQQLFLRWRSQAEGRRWAELFQSVQHDTGVLHRDLGETDADRRLANLQYILQVLESSAYARDLDALGVLDLLQQARRWPSPEGDLQPIETEEPKVRILTIHSSKGLQFPVVFLAGGFTGGKARAFARYRDDENKVVFNLDPDELAKSREKAEDEGEARRLLYVALTRAMFKLYMPWVADIKHSPGPLVKILRPALDTSGLEGLEECEVAALPAGAVQPVNAFVTKPALSPSKAAPLDPAGLFPPLARDLAYRRVTIRSFSSMKRKADMAGPTYDDHPPRLDDDEPHALEIQRPQEAQGPLQGTLFGDVVHCVLEKIDFASAGKAGQPADLLAEGSPSQVLIDRQLDRMPEVRANPEWRDKGRQLVSSLVWNALHTPLASLGSPLCQVPSTDRLHELEFHYPEQPTARQSESFLTGIMDLVIRKAGKYFLLDWKTNYLAAGYGPAEIEKSMTDADYFAQYRLYLNALSRWLQRVQPGFDPACHLGGVYYLYLRGMNGTDESQGVYFKRA